MYFDWRSASVDELLSRAEERMADWLRSESGDRVVVRIQGMGLRQSIRIVLTRGGEDAYARPPDEIDSLISKLREKQVVPGWGAWTWSRLWMVAGEWVLHQECDWMREPVFERPPIGESEYAIELARHPRDPQHVPVWLADRVAEFKKREAAKARRREARRAKKERETATGGAAEREPTADDPAYHGGGDDSGGAG